jgi:hypothetical protein
MKRILTTFKQKWPEYLLEILVIILGILAAFALNNWKEQKQQSQIEHSALSDLKNELYINLDKIDLALQNHEEGIQNSIILLEMFERGKVDLENFRMIHGLRTINPAFGVIDKLTTTGKIDYIRNDSLKQMLSKWKDEVLDLKENEDRHMDFVFNQMRPLEHKLILLGGMGQIEGIRNYNLYSEKEFKSNAGEVIKHHEFRTLWSRNMLRLQGLKSRGTRIKEMVKTMIFLLEQEINIHQ